MRLLLVGTNRGLALSIRSDSCVVDHARDALEAVALARLGEYDAILLDLELPRAPGTHLAALLRRDGYRAPIVALASPDSTAEIIESLDTGVDDYVTSPFNRDDLLTRIQVLARRPLLSTPERLTLGQLMLDRLQRKAQVDGVAVDLTPREYRLLEHFLLHPGRVVRRVELLETVCGVHGEPESNVIDVHIGNVRRKLKAAGADPLIHTIRGVGFVLKQAGQFKRVEQLRN